MKKKFAILLALFLIAVVCSAGCIDPEDPVDPIDPVDPVDPVDPITPVDPVDPVVPTEEYSVMFMLNYGDAGAYTAETVKAGETVSKPASPTRSGYTFNGWFTAAEGGAAYDFTQPVNADVTLYAQWKKKSSSSSGGHSHSYSWNVVKAANCTVDGQGQYVCSCGQVKSTETIPATGHLETEEVVNAVGDTEVKCKACGLVLVTIPASNELEINNLEELKAFAETVNAGTDYAGKTVLLMENIDLSGELWTPIGQGDNRFKGIFVGNGKTLMNLKVDQTSSDNAAGFFGVLNGEVQNLKFMNAEISGTTSVGVVAGKIFNTGSISNVEVTMAEVSGNHYVGGIVGYMYGSVSNCVVDDITVTATPNAVSGGYDNGDKVGGIVGYAAEESPVTDCFATDVTLTAFRDVGGIAGSAIGSSFVTGNSVDGVTITVDQITYFYGEKDVNAAGIVGRLLEGSTLDSSNSETDVTIYIKYTAKTTANLDKVLKLNAKTIEVVLNDDVALTANDAYLKLGGEDTESITINGNGKKLTLSTTYWSRLNTTNPDAKIIIKNAKLNSSQTSGTWNSYDLTFMCNVELEDVILEKALALDIGDGTAKLTRVDIFETHDYYALWICAEGATVTLEDVTINSGRGIKIDEQYVDSPAKVTLSITDATFKTEEKAAILVKSVAGADIALSNIDITGVTADSENEVWIDEDSAAYYDLVTVTGGTKVPENPQEYFDVISSSVNNGDTLHLPPGDYIIPDALQGKTLTIIGNGQDTVINSVDDGAAEGDCDYSFDGATVTFESVTITTKTTYFPGYARMKGTYNNCTINGVWTLYDNSTFNNCTFNIAGDLYNVWTWGATEATFNNCTFNSDGKALLLYGQVNTKLTLNDCTFNDKGGLSDLKAAIEIGNDYNKKYELIVNNCTVNGYEINDKGINTGTTLWGNKNSMGPDKLNVVVDGVDVY